MRRVFGNGKLGLVAARCDGNLKSLRFEIVAEQERQRLLVLDNKNLNRHGRQALMDGDALRPISTDRLVGHGKTGRVTFRTLLPYRIAMNQEVGHFSNVGGMITDPLEIFRTEKQMRA